jgi:RNA polymerase sigma factor (sigma-70 family)
MNPLADSAPLDADDAGLVARARGGSRDALEQLIRRHERWIYNIVRRMTYGRPDAEDATQEILIKVITKLATFEEKSSFRTWLYRIVVNHVLNMRRSRSEVGGWNFERYGSALGATPDSDMADAASTPADRQVLIEEAKALCTSGMLLCLDREQRLLLILGEILGVSDRVGAELLETTRENFRQKLSRARRDLHNFMQDKCGLVNEANPCRCAKKTGGFIKAGYVRPDELRFAQARVVRVREATGAAIEALCALDSAYAQIYRDHPFHESPDFVGRVRALLAEGRFTLPLELP